MTMLERIAANNNFDQKSIFDYGYEHALQNSGNLTSGYKR